ncbi:transposase [Desulfococcaceae bacterium HSG7]|nr:transposase [Desulfococcaceae bacterium HSG7]
MLTDNLTWEAAEIITVYSYRWVIEEFFRNAKQLMDMEGAAIRSKQGVTSALYLVSWTDFLLHYENSKQCAAGKQTKDSLTIPSIVRQLQYENLSALIERVRKDKKFVKRWSEVACATIIRKRKKVSKLIILNETKENREKWAA